VAFARLHTTLPPYHPYIPVAYIPPSPPGPARFKTPLCFPPHGTVQCLSGPANEKRVSGVRVKQAPRRGWACPGLSCAVLSPARTATAPMSTREWRYPPRPRPTKLSYAVGGQDPYTAPRHSRSMLESACGVGIKLRCATRKE
jgi:hypothetical protein